jgi:ComF family protein
MTASGWAEVTQHQLNNVLGLVYPPHCSVCECPIYDGFLCALCTGLIVPLPYHHCRQCGRTLEHPTKYCISCHTNDLIDGGGFFGLYEEGAPLAVLIQSLKYRGDRALVDLFGPLMVSASKHLPLPQAITFVPMQRARQRQRGFNQAELLARWLGKTLGCPVIPLLKKTRKTLPQADLPREQRLTNLDQALVALPSTVSSVWLVDDVRTTGATLSTCARALKKSGVQRVDTITIAAAIDSP